MLVGGAVRLSSFDLECLIFFSPRILLRALSGPTLPVRASSACANRRDSRATRSSVRRQTPMASASVTGGSLPEKRDAPSAALTIRAVGN